MNNADIKQILKAIVHFTSEDENGFEDGMKILIKLAGTKDRYKILNTKSISITELGNRDSKFKFKKEE